MRLKLLAVAVLCLCLRLHATPGPGALALLCSEEGETGCFGVQASMQTTGRFTSVDVFDVTNGNPALSAISGYGAILAWTDYTPADPTGLGNLLASYYSLGGKHLVVSTYAFSNPWAIAGAIITGAYAGLTNAGTNGDVSGNIVPVVASDPIFAGTNFATVTIFHNLNYAHPGVAPGATLLATDGAGVNMIARSANGVIDINVYPGEDNAAFYSFLAVALTTGGSVSVPVLAPAATLLLIIGIGLLAFYQLRRQATDPAGPRGQ